MAAPVRNAVPLELFVGCILILPALGISLVKPSVVGTTARASKKNVRSLGYSIYYTMVNIGGATGPLAASLARRHLGAGKIFYVAAFVVGLMFIGVLLFFREPKRVGDTPAPSVGRDAAEFCDGDEQPKFMIFLLIFTGYWIVFWQQWIMLPVYLHKDASQDIDVELVLVTDGIVVITCTILVNYALRKMAAFSAIVLGDAGDELVLAGAGVEAVDVGSGGGDCGAGDWRNDSAAAVLPNIFRSWRRRGSRERTWDSRFCRWELGR